MGKHTASLRLVPTASPPPPDLSPAKTYGGRIRLPLVVFLLASIVALLIIPRSLVLLTLSLGFLVAAIFFFMQGTTMAILRVVSLSEALLLFLMGALELLIAVSLFSASRSF